MRTGFVGVLFPFGAWHFKKVTTQMLPCLHWSIEMKLINIRTSGNVIIDIKNSIFNY